MAKVDATRGLRRRGRHGGRGLRRGGGGEPRASRRGGRDASSTRSRTRIVIAGQGTLGLELAEQLAALDTVVVPIGGGGLASGIAIALGRAPAGRAPRRRPGGGAARRSRAAQVGGYTIADGIAVKQPGELTDGDPGGAPRRRRDRLRRRDRGRDRAPARAGEARGRGRRRRVGRSDHVGPRGSGMGRPAPSSRAGTSTPRLLIEVVPLLASRRAGASSSCGRRSATGPARSSSCSR